MSSHRRVRLVFERSIAVSTTLRVPILDPMIGSPQTVAGRLWMNHYGSTESILPSAVMFGKNRAILERISLISPDARSTGSPIR
jgi:hypothetical protein